MYAITVILVAITALSGLVAFVVAPPALGFVDDVMFALALGATVIALIRLLAIHLRGEALSEIEKIDRSTAASSR